MAIPDFEERVEAYMDDVVAVGEDDNDLIIIDVICRQFEPCFIIIIMSGVILN